MYGDNARDIDMTHGVWDAYNLICRAGISPVILGIANSCCALLGFVTLNFKRKRKHVTILRTIFPTKNHVYSN